MNWSQMISNILASGMNQAELAQRVGCSQAHLSLIKTGGRKGCGYKIGTAIKGLHESLFPSESADRRAEAIAIAKLSRDVELLKAAHDRRRAPRTAKRHPRNRKAK